MKGEDALKEAAEFYKMTENEVKCRNEEEIGLTRDLADRERKVAEGGRREKHLPGVNKKAYARWHENKKKHPKERHTRNLNGRKNKQRVPRTGSEVKKVRNVLRSPESLRAWRKEKRRRRGESREDWQTRRALEGQGNAWHLPGAESAAGEAMMEKWKQARRWRLGQKPPEGEVTGGQQTDETKAEAPGKKAPGEKSVQEAETAQTRQEAVGVATVKDGTCLSEKEKRWFDGYLPTVTERKMKETPNVGAAAAEQKSCKRTEGIGARPGKTTAKRGPATPMRRRGEKLTGAHPDETMRAHQENGERGGISSPGRAHDGQKGEGENSVLGAGGGPPLGTPKYPEAFDEKEKTNPRAPGQIEKVKETGNRSGRKRQGAARAAAGKAAGRKGKVKEEGKRPSWGPA